MAQTVYFNNFDSDNILVRTLLTADIAAGVNSLPVSNTNDFAAGAVLIGDPGSGNSELATANAIAVANAIPLSAITKLGHNFNEPVLMLYGSQIKVYSAADVSGNGTQPPDANFALLATLSIDASKAQTSYTNNADNGGTWYKFTYYNGSTETSRATQNAVQSGQAHYVGLNDIRAAAGFQNNPNVTDAMIAKKRDAAEKEVIGALLPVYQFPLPQPTNPIVVEVTKELAAGMLMHELYVSSNSQMAAEGESKAQAARMGGGSFTGLQELVDRDVVLVDALFNETTIEEAHAFGGWPDSSTEFIENTAGPGGDVGGDDGHQFRIDEVY